jgi:Leucine-rich repeat (LRR) protein
LLELNASFNNLAFMPPNFGFMLVCLEKLELHLNKLATIPASICELKSLKYLDLHMNRLRDLPSSLGNLTQLEYLDVSSNFDDLISVPESMGTLVSLTYCDLSFNQIKELPNSIGRLEKLTKFKLDGNPLESPPMKVVEHSHEAVMQYLHQRYINDITERDFQVSASSKTLLYKGRNEYNPWIPACAGNSPLAAWIGSVCGGMGNVLSGGAGEFFKFQQYPKDDAVGPRL